MAKSVFVGCKIPTGMTLQLRNPDNSIAASVSLEGAMLKGTPDIPAPNALKEDGIGLTLVDADFWEAWEKWATENKFPPYINGFIFAADRQSDIKSEAREKQGEKKYFPN